MAESAVPLSLFLQLFACGAMIIFAAFALATLVLMIHLTSLPERRQRPQASVAPAASFTD
ncbi:MAG TPA: hypothetical protein PKD53_18870 [Chloroflexaceae bacterium]|mgnify:CR=1 FL=1|nr:hypothetical protein [Chloroflexaceae bacterium]